ncbi:helix-turn-helix domain-containing protein [Zunongwangia pacifica]|uniref:AraC family transcriptional regulator n=1 Tax=Zunongwangia pacifica TaxID=2911062 RepID=A0A9X2CQX5_9FLAO|nr:AraC family transcriptional regulator [Zunongwangia pacifica]MCL6220472.1 AraC family transcriptional regulator [Zunongwangia pacifica]
MNIDLQYRQIKPDKSLTDFVDSFWLLQDQFTRNEGVIVPNGKIDLFFSKMANNEFRVTLMGLETKPKPLTKQDVSKVFAVSFNPLAMEYILQRSIANLLDSGMRLGNDFWDFNIDDLTNFDTFCKKATQKIQSLLPQEIDSRKINLFKLIFATNGEITVKELSEKIHWSSRQINRYFNEQFGLSLKAYCKIIRFRASLQHIKEGKLFPQHNFTDQSHFIKDIKKLSGVSPKELHKNKNDRFLQFSVSATK